MKHIFQKNRFQGGGKSKPQPKPAILRPPEIGNFEVLNSYSVAEVVDLISDGPIAGLVNQNGEPLGEEKSILQGVYLDNTPIEISNAKSTNLEKTNVISSLTNVSESASLASVLNLFGSVYYNSDGSPKQYYYNRGTNNAPKTALNIKVPESNFFLARILENNKPKGHYSPLNDEDQFVNNTWLSDSGEEVDLDKIFNNDIPTFFYKKDEQGRSIEIHYDGKNSLFSSGSLLSNLKEFLKEEISESAAGVKQEIAKKADTALTNFEKSDLKGLNWAGESIAYVVVKVGEKDFPSEMDMGDGKDISVASEENNPTKLAKTFFNFGEFQDEFSNNDIIEILVPKVEKENGETVYKYKEEIYGCVIYKINTSSREYSAKVENGKLGEIIYTHQRIFLGDVQPFISNSDKIKITFHKGIEPKYAEKASKYNFLNVSCEFKNGKEYQSPLKYFKNIYNDFEYNTELFGPFKITKYVQRISSLKNSKDPSLNINIEDAIDGDLEGSSDVRTAEGVNYSNWNVNNQLDEQASSITHTIENPEVTSVYFTLGISSLSDTLEVDQNIGLDKTTTAGSKVPSIVNIQVEWGKIKSDGKKDSTSKKIYSILALVEGQMLIDFGSPTMEKVPEYLQKSIKEYSNKSLKEVESQSSFQLPSLEDGEDPTSTKRYIKITKLSAETNSVLISKNIFLSKVTEIIENDLSYPFSAIAGIKLDARSFSSTPERSYDCRLKLVKIPSNYRPLNKRGIDKRYVKNAAQYNQQSQKNQIYYGDWDGSFTTGWTDNPAWIIYDLLTSKRYGLGGYIDQSQINKWELYKIARFCDAVDDNGFFVGVSDGVKGLEPRYSCNIMFKEQTKIFDAINIVANLFRGITFFSNSEIHFLDDRPRIPIAIFTNSNVKDGLFNYTNNRRDEQFNTVEVAYLDRFDNYQSKIEYVQDEADIRKRGIFKTTINTMGVTSRAMARRIGQHIIYQTIKENQTVEFVAGLESLLCRPGDLVILEDELKTRAANFGRILEVDIENGSLRIDQAFDEGLMNGTITVYTPTGYTTNVELNDLAQLRRSRVDYFDVTGNLINSSDTILTGRYYFSGYVSGYPLSTPGILAEQYPIYTGHSNEGHKLFCYYNTNYTGFVFSTGKAYQDNTLYDKVISNTGVESIFDIQTRSQANRLGLDYVGFRYNTSANRRGASGVISGKIAFNQEDAYRGIVATELDSINHAQITKFALSDYNNLEYGSRVFLDENDVNYNLISTISEGSPYRLERQNASDQIYKIISIRENNQNEYSIIASKYNTGKFTEIEKFIAEDFLPETYYTGPITVNEKGFKELDPPTILSFTAINKTLPSFALTGTWQAPDDSVGVTGYRVEVFNRISNDYFATETANTYIGVSNLSALGDWRMRVYSLGSGSLVNSLARETGEFVAYTEIKTIDKPAIVKFTIL